MKMTGKRILAFIAALMLLASAFTLASCGGEGDDTKASDTENKSPDGESGTTSSGTDGVKLPQELIYVAEGGVEIRMMAPADAIIAALGEPKTTYEAPSCAFLGNDYYYNYGSFELSAYDEGGEKFVYSVYLKDDLTETPEGLSIGMKESEAAALYGASGRQDNGSYAYTVGNAQLNIIIEDGKVAAIEYVALVTEAE